MGGTIKHFSLAVDFFPGIKNNLYSGAVSSDHVNDVFLFDSNYMNETGQKVSLKDSSAFGYSIKIGFLCRNKILSYEIVIDLGTRVSIIIHLIISTGARKKKNKK